MILFKTRQGKLHIVDWYYGGAEKKSYYSYCGEISSYVNRIETFGVNDIFDYICPTCISMCKSENNKHFRGDQLYRLTTYSKKNHYASIYVKHLDTIKYRTWNKLKRAKNRIKKDRSKICR